MLGATGRQVMGPIRGSGDFLAYGSPSISAVGCFVSVVSQILKLFCGMSPNGNLRICLQSLNKNICIHTHHNVAVGKIAFKHITKLRLLFLIIIFSQILKLFCGTSPNGNLRILLQSPNQNICTHTRHLTNIEEDERRGHRAMRGR